MSAKSTKRQFPSRIVLGEVEVMNSLQYRHREMELKRTTAKLERTHSLNMLCHQRCLNETKQFLKAVQTVDGKKTFMTKAKRLAGKTEDKNETAQTVKPILTISAVSLPRSHSFLQKETKTIRRKSLYNDPFEDEGSVSSDDGTETSKSSKASDQWARRVGFSSPADSEKHLRKAVNNKNSFWRFKERQKAIMLRASICNTLFSMIDKKRQDENVNRSETQDDGDGNQGDKLLRKMRVRGRSFTQYKCEDPEEEYGEASRRISAKYNEQVGKLRKLTRQFSQTSLATVPKRRHTYCGSETKDLPIDANSNLTLASSSTHANPSNSTPLTTPRRKTASVMSPSVISI